MRTYFETFPESYDPESIRIINTPDPVSKSTFFYVQEVGYLKIRIAHITRRQNLDSFLFVVVLSGSGTLEYKGKGTKLTAGDCFWIDCMNPHSYQSSKDNPWELLWVHFNGSTTAKYYEYFSTMQNFAWSSFGNTRFENLLREILELFKKKGVCTEILASELLMKLLTEILVSVTKEGIPAYSEDPGSKLYAIREYIDVHFLEKLSLNTLGEEFFISKFHLSREFKKTFGMNITDYIQLQRITYAKRILRFSDKSLDEIATMCQINDASHFIKQFKMSEGMTPREFRRKWREKK